MMSFFKLDSFPNLLSITRPELAWGTGIFYLIWLSFGMQILIYSNAMNAIDDEIFESARLDGVNDRQEFFSIVLPMIWPTISTLITLIMTGIFTASGPILLFTEGAYKTTTISYYIWTQVYGAPSGGYPVASAIGLFFTLIGLPIVLLTKWICTKLDTGVSY